ASLAQVRAYSCFARFSCGFGDQLFSLLPTRLIGGCTLLFGESRRRRTSYCGKEHRRLTLRKSQRRQSERLLCRGYPGRDSNALIQDSRSEGDLAYLNPAISKQAGESLRDRQATGRRSHCRRQRAEKWRRRARKRAADRGGQRFPSLGRYLRSQTDRHLFGRE